MKVLAFGEILFDCYPTTKKIGGAPLNFCAHLAKLGGNSSIFSALGKDSAGEEALSLVCDFGVDTGYLQTDSSLPTGECRVSYQGLEPVYELVFPCAYDAILENTALYDTSFDVLYFGTLACRGEVSRATLEQLLEKGNFPIRFFDMNLRQQYYSKELVLWGLSACNMVKMNREEFAYVRTITGITEPEVSDALAQLCRKHRIQTAILTLDKDGACVYDGTNGFFQAPIVPGDFVSAVGAGDSFCACLLFHIFRGASIPTALKKASLLAGFVVSREEAIPDYPPRLQKELLANA